MQFTMKNYFYCIITVVAMLAALTPAHSHAAVNLQLYTGTDAVIPTAQAKEVLAGIFMHNPDQLERVQVELSNVRMRRDMNVAFLYVGRQEDFFDTEIYVITLDPMWNVIDGAMLGYDGDAKYLTLEDPRHQTEYIPSFDIDYTLAGDTISAKRSYTYSSTSRGGKYFSKKGTVTNPFLIRKDGKIVAMQAKATAIQTQGDANYLSRDHKPATTSTTRGEYYLIGMDVMNVAQTPASALEKPEALNELARQMNNIIGSYSDNAIENIQTSTVAEFARWSTNYILRQGNETLTWIARNPDQQLLSQFILTTLQQSGMGETQWLAAKVKALKDKKARKWWQNWLKKEMGVEVK